MGARRVNSIFVTHCYSMDSDGEKGISHVWPGFANRDIGLGHQLSLGFSIYFIHHISTPAGETLERSKNHGSGTDGGYRHHAAWQTDSGVSGAVPMPPESLEPRIHPSNGASRRTFAGRWRYSEEQLGNPSTFDAATGEPHYQLQRLEGVPNVFASPVGASGRVYLAGRDGTMLVIRNARMYEVLPTNTLDNEIYLRRYRNLYSIAEQ